MATQAIFDDVKPFPGRAVPPAAVGSKPGHNRPMPANDVLREFNDLLAQRDGFEQRIDDLCGASQRAIATNEDTAGKCGELVKQIGAAERVINDAHKVSKEPYLEATRAIDGAKREKLAPLEAAKAAVNGKLTTYLREERARQEAEARRIADERRQAEAEQRRREEEARAKSGGLTCQEASTASGATYIPCGKPADQSVRLPKDERAYNMCEVCAHHNIRNRGGISEGAPSADNPPVVFEAPEPVAAPEPTRIRGDFGALTTGKTVWKHEITDIEVAFMAVSNNEKVREAIDKAVGAMVRSGVRQIEGVRIFSDIAAQVR